MKNFTKTSLLIAFLILANNIIATAQYITVTLAGIGIAGFSGDGGQAKIAKLSNPTDVCMDATQHIYFVDAGNSRIRKISAINGVITTIAGGGTSTADGVPATTALLSDLTKMGIDGSGNIYISTSNKIKMVNAATGIITTVAGTGTAGYNGDGVLATTAELNAPSGVCVDAAGNIYIADVNNYRIRKVSAGTGLISTYAGTGVSGSSANGVPATAATFNGENSICMDASGNVYCANSSTISKINVVTGIITTLISPGEIDGICSDGGGYIYYVQDSCGCIRLNLSNNTTTTIANNGLDGYNGDGGNSIITELNEPSGVCVDAAGNLYIADKSNYRIRKIAKLTNTPSFIYGTSQMITPCPGYTASINVPLAVADIDSPVTETWTVLTPPTIGTLSGFPATVMSGGKSGLATPTGTSYTPAPGYNTGSDSFQVQISNGTNSAIVKIYVSISVKSVGNISGASSVCQGSMLTLTDTSIGGAWSVTNLNAGITETTNGNGNLTGLAAGVDTAIYTLSAECPVTTSHIVTVNPLPDTASISGNDTVCIGATIVLSDAASGGIWSSLSPANISVSSSGIVTGLSYGVIGTGTIRYTTSNAWCSYSETKVLNINTPVIPISSTDIVCLGASINIEEDITGGTWSKTNANANVTGVADMYGHVTGITTGTDTVIYTNTNTCGTGTTSAVIFVNPAANAGTISGATSVCVGSGTVNYMDTTAGGTWSTSTNGYAEISAIGNVTGLVAGADTVIYTVNNGCHSAYAAYPINIASTAIPPAITGPGNVCAEAAITLADALANGTWTVSNSHATVSGTGIVTAVSTGTDTVLYIVNNACGTGSAIQVININPLPFAGMVTGDDSVCQGATIVLGNTTSGGAWSAINNNASVSSSGAVTGSLPGTDIITYIVSNSCGADTATHAITITNCTEGISNSVNPPVISIYPNPTSGLLNIEWLNLNSNHAYIIIRDIASRIIYSTDITDVNNNKGSTQINLSSLEEGVYMITVNSGSLYCTNKLVINK